MKTNCSNCGGLIYTSWMCCPWCGTPLVTGIRCDEYVQAISGTECKRDVFGERQEGEPQRTDYVYEIRSLGGYQMPAAVNIATNMTWWLSMRVFLAKLIVSAGLSLLGIDVVWGEAEEAL